MEEVRSAADRVMAGIPRSILRPSTSPRRCPPGRRPWPSPGHDGRCHYRAGRLRWCTVERLWRDECRSASPGRRSCRTVDGRARWWCVRPAPDAVEDLAVPATRVVRTRPDVLATGTAIKCHAVARDRDRDSLTGQRYRLGSAPCTVTARRRRRQQVDRHSGSQSVRPPPRQCDLPPGMASSPATFSATRLLRASERTSRGSGRCEDPMPGPAARERLCLVWESHQFRG
jgi:hypothetical protein